jgi:hypothetical protein
MSKIDTHASAYHNPAHVFARMNTKQTAAAFKKEGAHALMWHGNMIHVGEGSVCTACASPISGFRYQCA